MYDNVCKFIAENFSRDIATWLLNEPIELTVLQPTELQVEPIRADNLILLQSSNLILHIEFQTSPSTDIPFRMTDYRLRLNRCFPGKTVYQVVIYLRKSNSPLVWQNSFELPGLKYTYNVVRLWEVPSEELLSQPGLLPFAVLSQTEDRVETLTEVAKRVDSIEDVKVKSNIAATAAILAGLVLDKMVIKKLLREEIMKESVMYQEIKSEGFAEGIKQGRQQGVEQGLQQEAVNLTLRQLTRKFGNLSAEIPNQIQQLSLEKIETLAEMLLDFQNIEDLVTWLGNNSN